MTVYLAQLHHNRSARNEHLIGQKDITLAFSMSEEVYKNSLNAEGELQLDGAFYDIRKVVHSSTGYVVYAVRDTRDEQLVGQLKDILEPFRNSGKAPAKPIRWVQYDFLPSQKLQLLFPTYPVLTSGYLTGRLSIFLSDYDNEINPPPPRTFLFV